MLCFYVLCCETWYKYTYLTVADLKDTLLLNYYVIRRIINNLDCTALQNFDIHDFKFIVGPHFIDCHWYAVIVD